MQLVPVESAPALEDGRIESFEDDLKIRFRKEISELIDVEYASFFRVTFLVVLSDLFRG